MSEITKIAPATDNEHTIIINMTVLFSGACSPKVANKSASHEISTMRNGTGSPSSVVSTNCQ